MHRLISMAMRVTSFLLLSALLFAGEVFAADVYYMGGSSAGGETGKNKEFTLQKRVDDLLDFKNYGEYGPDRSGRISGNVSVEVNTNNIFGNKDQSFLREGVYSVWESTLNVQERLWDDYNFEGQIFMRRTDDRRIESRKDVRIKQLDMKISNPKNMLHFGDFYGEFSQFTLGQSLEGFDLNIQEVDGQKYHFIAARRNEADWATDQYQRNVFGGEAEYSYNGGGDFNLFNMGVQAVTSQDDKGSVSKVNSAIDLNNTVVSLDGEIRPVKNFGVIYEVAQSGYNSNEKDPNENMIYGSAFRIQPELKVKDAKLRYLYYYVTPKFYTDSGSAMPDKEQHQLSFDWKIMRGLSISLIENYYWNHLKGSRQTMRTINDEKYMSVYIRPLVKSPSFTIRPYVNLLSRDSDDLYNTLESATNTYGVSFNDSVADGMVNYGMGYEHREYDDIANHSAGSEIYNRVMGNIGLDLNFFGRRLYLSDDISVDFRSTKTDNNSDVTVANSVSCVYDFHDLCSFRGATNLQNMNGAGPGTNTTTTRNYGEFIFTFDKKRSLKWMLRAEQNMVRPENGSNGYTEERCIMKVMSNF
ncbi:MAG: hypothetical protein ABIA77_05340 [Candidatus Omnitrophota bacterium]